MLPDFLRLLPLAILVISTTVVTEWAVRTNRIPYWISRKILHILAVGSCAYAPYVVDRHSTLIAVVLPAWILLLGLVAGKKLMREESGRPAWGIVWFPLPYLLLLWFHGPSNDAAVAFPMAVLAICDPLATIAGKLFAKRQYYLTGEPKSLTGNLAFFLSFLLLAWSFDLTLTLPSLLGVAALVTYAEALGSYGRDNLYIPLLSAILLYFSEGDHFAPEYYVLPAVVFVWFTVSRNKLLPGGAGTAALLGILVAITAGPYFLLPLFLFFGSSVLVGRLFSAREVLSDAKDQQPRDALQVLANGGVYGLLALGLGWLEVRLQSIPVPSEAAMPTTDQLTFLLYLSMAVATADTWSSEIGKYFRGVTRDLVRFKVVPPGLSGGVSLSGTLAGLLGSGLIALLSLLHFPSLEVFVCLLLGGFTGMLLDSILGSLFQRQYHDGNNWSDTPGLSSSVATRGVSWMTNDAVNLLSNVITVLLCYGWMSSIGW